MVCNIRRLKLFSRQLLFSVYLNRQVPLTSSKPFRDKLMLNGTCDSFVTRDDGIVDWNVHFLHGNTLTCGTKMLTRSDPEWWSFFILTWAFINLFTIDVPVYHLWTPDVAPRVRPEAETRRPRFTYVFGARQYCATGQLAPPVDTPGIRPTKLSYIASYNNERQLDQLTTVRYIR